MHLSSKTHNACLAVLELSMRYDQSQPINLRTIAEPHGISCQFLVQILLQLKRAGLVRSIRGACGGYQLTVPPHEISLLDVMTAMEGPPPDTPHSSRENAVVHVMEQTWSRMCESQQVQLAEITFDQLVQQAQQETADMYYI